MPSADKHLLYNAPPQEKSKEADKREMISDGQMDHLPFMGKEALCDSSIGFTCWTEELPA